MKALKRVGDDDDIEYKFYVVWRSLGRRLTQGQLTRSAEGFLQVPRRNGNMLAQGKTQIHTVSSDSTRDCVGIWRREKMKGNECTFNECV